MWSIGVVIYKVYVGKKRFFRKGKESVLDIL